MNYRQWISSALLKVGDGDKSGARDDFAAARDEARRIDPEGPREAEVLQYQALFEAQEGFAERAAALEAQARAIFSRFEEAS